MNRLARRHTPVDAWQHPLPADTLPVRHAPQTAAVPASSLPARSQLTQPAPTVSEWLAVHRVPVSPAGTVLLLKGVGLDYRSLHGCLYWPGTTVVDPDFGRRMNAGLYLCATRRAVESFTDRWHPEGYRLLLVEAAAAALVMCADRRKVAAPRVYVHREIFK